MPTQAEYQALKDELTAGHPGTGAYNVDDALATAELNALNVERNKTEMTGSELFDNTDSASYDALSDAKKARWLAFCAIDSVDPFGPAVQIVTEIWGGGSPTIVSLAAARKETTSRAIIAFGREARIGDVQNARGLV